jgi:2-polyprenyl-3-methyl-5-hydroxy-6-metoxy-1,4-benzoquinol methylase
MALSKYDIEADRVNQPGTSHSFMLELVGSNKRVLDVGCDTGYLGEVLTTLGNHVSGIEIDPITAAEAEKRLERVVVADLDAGTAYDQFTPGEFDVIIFGDVLEHLRDPLPVLRAARPLLAPGGSVIISTPNVAHGDIRLSLLKGNFRYTKTGILDETHLRFFTKDSLVSFLREAGFSLAELKRTGAPLFGTETGLQAADFDPTLIATLQADTEATTYQFVVRAVPEDADSYVTEQALRVDELQQELDASRRREQASAEQVTTLTKQLEQLTGELSGLTEQVVALRQENERSEEHIAELGAALDRSGAEMQALLHTRTLRAARVPQALYARTRASWRKSSPSGK